MWVTCGQQYQSSLPPHFKTNIKNVRGAELVDFLINQKRPWYIYRVLYIPWAEKTQPQTIAFPLFIRTIGDYVYKAYIPT